MAAMSFVPGVIMLKMPSATTVVAKLRGIENQVIKETLAGFVALNTAFNMLVK